MATTIHGLPTIDFSVAGWNGPHSTFLAMLDDLLYTNLVVTLGEAVSENEALYCHTDGKWYKALGLNGIPALAYACADGVLDDDIRARIRGTITDDSWSWTIGSANPVWLSGITAGALTQVRPAVGAGEQLVGYPITATTILLVGPSELEVLESSSSSSSSGSSSSSSRSSSSKSSSSSSSSLSSSSSSSSSSSLSSSSSSLSSSSSSSLSSSSSSSSLSSSSSSLSSSCSSSSSNPP